MKKNRFKKTLNKKIIFFSVGVAIIAAIIGSYFTIGYIGSDYIGDYIDNLNIIPLGNEIPAFFYDADTGYFNITKSETKDFKILQITDSHIGGGVFCKNLDKKTVDTLLKTITAIKPDIIIITGDIIYPFSLQTGNLNNIKVARQVSAFFEKLKIPWAPLFGNHENSGLTKANREELADFIINSNFKYCMFSKNPKGVDIDGFGNGIINIRNSDGTINNSLILLDSNSNHSVGKYDKIHDNQVDWYKNAIKNLSNEENGCKEDEVIKSLAFFHIPLEEYQTAWDLYEADSSEVNHLYGVKDEKILCPKTTEKFEKGKLFDTMVELKSTKATFCGHNHKNNFAIVYKGIQLTFGNSALYNGLFGINRDDSYRGGTLITLDGEGNFESENIFAKNI